MKISMTSGATEAYIFALKGVVEARRIAGQPLGHMVVSAIEHKAVLDPAQWLAHQGVEVTYVVPDAQGRVSVQTLENARREDTFLGSVRSEEHTTEHQSPGQSDCR